MFEILLHSARIAEDEADTAQDTARHLYEKEHLHQARILKVSLMSKINVFGVYLKLGRTLFQTYTDKSWYKQQKLK